MYSLWGQRLVVHADAMPVLEAIDYRLRGFRPHAGAVDGAGPIHVHFLDEMDAVPVAMSGEDRPVYDTPFGSLMYRQSVDLLHGVFGPVALRCEASAGRCVMRAPAFGGRDLYLATHPLTTVCLMELMERRDRFSLHAACLARGADGILIAGPSGAGKSTLTLALARGGLALLSDDVVFLEHEPAGSIRALGFADALGVSGYAVDRFPELKACTADVPDDGFPKPLARVEELFGPALQGTCVPSAIVFPEVTPDSVSAITPLPSGEALLRLMPDVLLTDPVSTQAHLAAIGALLRQVDCYALRSGRDLERAADLLAALL